MRLCVATLRDYPGNAWRLEKCYWPTVLRYARMKTAAPPIVVDRTGFILDGLHRVAVATLKGQREIEGEMK